MEDSEIESKSPTHAGSDQVNPQAFIERARKRVTTALEDVEKAKAALAKEETKWLYESALLTDGERRLTVLEQEANEMVEDPIPPIVPADFFQEMAQLRASVAELMRERDLLRPQDESRPRRRTSLCPRALRRIDSRPSQEEPAFEHERLPCWLRGQGGGIVMRNGNENGMLRLL